MTLRRREHVFLVRLWLEPSAECSAYGWRGSAHHAASGRRFYFSSLAQLKRYLHDELGIVDDSLGGDAGIFRLVHEPDEPQPETV
ncbi:MAG TPA: hypothetical protein VGD09_17390 [Blastococcus sp.]|jgi:hypothetical protein